MIAKFYTKNILTSKLITLTRVNFFLSVFLLCFMPIIGHTETITYNVCESGCEYSSIYDVKDNINSLENLNDKDIIINFNGDYSDYFRLENNAIKSLTLNGNNHTIDEFGVVTNNITINKLTAKNIMFGNPQKINITKSNIYATIFMFIDLNGGQISTSEFSFNELLTIDDESLSKIKGLAFLGKIKFEGIDFKDKLIESAGGTLNIYNCQLSKLVSIPQSANVEVNAYNSTFDSLKYKKYTSLEEMENELALFEAEDAFNTDALNYDIYDLDVSEYNRYSNTTVYFDKELELKLNDKGNLTDILDYYTSDKNLDYVIEDESIAKIENKELIGLKEGQTNVTVTTDDGHIIYKINLTVEKETIVEQIEDKTIEIPPAGIKIKLWVLVLAILLFGVIGIFIYLLIRNKKVSK